MPAAFRPLLLLLFALAWATGCAGPSSRPPKAVPEREGVGVKEERRRLNLDNEDEGAAPAPAAAPTAVADPAPVAPARP